MAEASSGLYGGAMFVLAIGSMRQLKVIHSQSPCELCNDCKERYVLSSHNNVSFDSWTDVGNSFASGSSTTSR